MIESNITMNLSQSNFHFYMQIPASTSNMGAGYDAFGLSLGLYNDVYFDFNLHGSGGIQIKIEGQGEKLLPRDKNNLIYRAFETSFNTFHPSGISYFHSHSLIIRCVNRIPLSRGLGSSATAVLGGYIGGYTIAEFLKKGVFHTLTEHEKINLMHACIDFEGHADNVVASLFGGFNIIYPIFHDNCHSYKTHKIPFSHDQLKIIVCIPNYTVNTAHAREVLSPQVSRSDAVFNLSRASLMIASLLSKNYSLLKYAVEDRIHQNARIHLLPGFESVMNESNRHGALCVFLSGSGPCVAAFSRYDQAERVQNAMRIGFQKVQIASTSHILEVQQEGIRVEKKDSNSL